MGYFYVNVVEQQIITDGSMTGDITSSEISVTHSPRAKAIFEYCVQAVWSAGSSPLGTLKLQASIDNSNYVDISGTTVGVSGNTGSVIWNITNHSYKYLRLIYTRSSGSGTLNAYFNGKSFNI